jgi:hypothetical protein
MAFVRSPGQAIRSSSCRRARRCPRKSPGPPCRIAGSGERPPCSYLGACGGLALLGWASLPHRENASICRRAEWSAQKDRPW